MQKSITTDMLAKMKTLDDTLAICKARCETQRDIVDCLAEVVRLQDECLATIQTGTCQNAPHLAYILRCKVKGLVEDVIRMSKTANEA